MEVRHHKSLTRRQMSNSGVSPTIINDMMTTDPNETINSLLLKKMDSMRTANIILEVFSLLAVLGIVTRILYDAKKTNNLKVSLHPRRYALLHSIHVAERVPLIISTIIALQQIIFIGVGASAMGSLLATKCAQTAQAVVPFVFIVPYVFLVFGIETTYRSLQREKFGPYPKWTFPICLASIAALTFITWIPTAVKKHADQCRGSLIWWTSGHGTAAVVMLSLLMISCLTMAIIITLQLLKSIKTDPNYRIAASKMVYYLVFIVVLIIFILPFYAQASAGTLPDESTSAEVASVILSISGILFAAWHVFDRANCYQLAFRPTETPWQGKQQIRIFGPNDLDRSKRVESPIDNALFDQSTEDLTASDIKFNHSGSDSTRSVTPPLQMSENILASQGPTLPPLVSTSPLTGFLSEAGSLDDPLPPPTKPISHQRNKPSYSLFPSRETQGDADGVRFPAPVRSSRSHSTVRNSTNGRQSMQEYLKSMPHLPWIYNEQLPGSRLSTAPNATRESSSSKQTVEVGFFLESGMASPRGGNVRSSLQPDQEGKGETTNVPNGQNKILLSQLSGGPKVGITPIQPKPISQPTTAISSSHTISRRPVNKEPTFAALSSYRFSRNIRQSSNLRSSIIVNAPPPPTSSLPAPPTLSRPSTSPLKPLSSITSSTPPLISAFSPSSTSPSLSSSTAFSSLAPLVTPASRQPTPKSRESKDLPPLPLEIRKSSIGRIPSPPRVGLQQRSESPHSIHRAGLGLRLNPVTPEPPSSSGSFSTIGGSDGSRST